MASEQNDRGGRDGTYGGLRNECDGGAVVFVNNKHATAAANELFMFSEILRSVKAEWNLTVADALHGPEWFLQNKEKILGTRNHSQLMQFFLLRKRRECCNLPNTNFEFFTNYCVFVQNRYRHIFYKILGNGEIFPIKVLNFQKTMFLRTLMYAIIAN
ncbi:hypothetical protein QTP88_004590 [Uroleucon formosanum]